MKSREKIGALSLPSKSVSLRRDLSFLRPPDRRDSLRPPQQTPKSLSKDNHSCSRQNSTIRKFIEPGFQVDRRESLLFLISKALRMEKLRIEEKISRESTLLGLSPQVSKRFLQMIVYEPKEKESFVDMGRAISQA